MVVVPNSRLASAIITNYNQPRKEMAVLVDVGVDYASDLGEVEEVTVGVAADVLREVPGGSGDFKPFVRFHTFSEYRIEFTVVLRVNEYVDQYRLRHEFAELHGATGKTALDSPARAHIILSRTTGEQLSASGCRGDGGLPRGAQRRARPPPHQLELLLRHQHDEVEYQHLQPLE